MASITTQAAIRRRRPDVGSVADGEGGGEESGDRFVKMSKCFRPTALAPAAAACNISSLPFPQSGWVETEEIMVERRSELKRRYHRKEKMAKLKAKLAAAKSGGDKDAILKKIHVLSPWWTEPAAAK